MRPLLFPDDRHHARAGEITLTPAFREILAAAVQRSGLPARRLARGECRSDDGAPCMLCHARTLDYGQECALKQAALQDFWHSRIPGTALDDLVPSPTGRGYRTVTKRRVLAQRGAPVLGLIDPEGDSPGGLLPVGRCAIEPAEHAPIYREIARWLGHPSGAELARALRYVILRGTSGEHALILNVRTLSPALTRAANLLSRAVTAGFRSVIAVFLHHEAAEERYYMGRASFRGAGRTRKLFGSDGLHLDLGGRRFRFSPLSFSQVNVSLLPALTAAAGGLLELTRTTTLYDLYCGYGLFGLSLADRAGHVIGIEAAPLSVAAAIANARRFRTSNIRFHRTEITGESLAQRAAGMDEHAAVLLDPPRNGTAPGVIEFIAGQQPARVLHLFCNIDLVPAELERWSKAGYAAARAVPFDMFPGTATVEVMVLLKPAGRGG